MRDRINVEPDAKTKRIISEFHGGAFVLDALMDGEKPKSSLPGFALAVALVEKQIADMRAQMAGAVYRCAARAGHDISNVTSIYTISVGKDGTPQFEPL